MLLGFSQRNPIELGPAEEPEPGGSLRPPLTTHRHHHSSQMLILNALERIMWQGLSDAGLSAEEDRGAPQGRTKIQMSPSFQGSERQSSSQHEAATQDSGECRSLSLHNFLLGFHFN